MSRRLVCGKSGWLRLGVGALAIAFVAGCAGGPSEKELSLLEQQKQAMEASEKTAAEKKAEKARLERRLAEKRAEKQALEKTRAATEANLAAMTGE